MSRIRFFSIFKMRDARELCMKKVQTCRIRNGNSPSMNKNFHLEIRICKISKIHIFRHTLQGNILILRNVIFQDFLTLPSPFFKEIFCRFYSKALIFIFCFAIREHPIRELPYITQRNFPKKNLPFSSPFFLQRCLLEKYNHPLLPIVTRNFRTNPIRKYPLHKVIFYDFWPSPFFFFKY